MAVTMTVTGDVTLDQAAYDRAVYFALRPKLFFDQICDVQPTNQSMPGTSVIFNIQADNLGIQTGALNQSSDVSPVDLSDSQITVTLSEYGAAVKSSALLRGTSYVPFNPVAANIVGYSAGASQNRLARQELVTADNVIYATGGSTTPTARGTIEPEDTLEAANIRRLVAQLRASDVSEIDGNYYVCFIHPDVSYDLQGETGGAPWTTVQQYTQPGAIMTGEIGHFAGARFIETSTAPLLADAGSSTTLTDVYQTIAVGRQAVAKAYSQQDGNGPFPKVVPGPITDLLRRFVPLGWYWLGGYNQFRQEAIRRVESSSSIGSN